jgi:hypothetical protein
VATITGLSFALLLAGRSSSGGPAATTSAAPTPTAIGLKPDSVMVAAQLKNQCLIAHCSPSIGGLTVSVQPALASGGCLLGRSINHL